MRTVLWEGCSQLYRQVEVSQRQEHTPLVRLKQEMGSLLESLL